MKQDILNKWTRSLTSGKYKKCIGALRKGSGKNQKHCGLGVLCDLHAKATGNDNNDQWAYYDDYSELPWQVADWAGLPDGDPNLTENLSFTQYNDEKRLPFKKLAAMLHKAQKDGLLGKIIPAPKPKRKKKKASKVKRCIKAGCTGITGEVAEEQPQGQVTIQ